VATGLAWDAGGADILFPSRPPHAPAMAAVLTGQLGEGDEGERPAALS